MLSFGNSQPNRVASKWQRQLDQFVRDHRQELAALVWGMSQQPEGENKTVGIDCQQVPRFVYCPRDAVEKLNFNVNEHLQEILGVIDGHNSAEEVLMIGIGDGEIKLINFKPEPSPPECFEEVGEKIGILLDKLEQSLGECLQD
ncbi:MAG: hypothetical protein WA865_09780 [Spirulinaceae cyanobacterium]